MSFRQLSNLHGPYGEDGRARRPDTRKLGVTPYRQGSAPERVVHPAKLAPTITTS